MGALYRLDFPNGKSYVGITAKTAAQRFSAHLGTAKKPGSTTALSRAIRKYGAEAVKVVTLAISNSWEYLQLIEKNAIRVFGTFGKGGYNMTLGGDGAVGVVPGEATRLKMSLGKKGVPLSPTAAAKLAATRFGRPVSPETRAKIGRANTGRRHLPDALVKIAKNSARVGEATREKRRRSMLLGSKGVTFDTQRGKWVAQLHIKGAHKYLGRFATEQEALAVRTEAVRKLLAGEPL